MYIIVCWLLEVMFPLQGGVWYIKIELVYINCSQRVLDATIYFFVKYGSIHFNIYGLTEAKVKTLGFFISSDIFVYLTSDTHAHGHWLDLEITTNSIAIENHVQASLPCLIICYPLYYYNSKSINC